MFAQSLLEYGVLATFVSAIEGALDSVRDWVDRSPEQAWALVGVLAILIIIWSRSSRR
jgi:hypothetical protein